MLPRDTLALVERGSAHLDKKDYASAIADADRALVLDPKMARAYNLRGTARRAAGDPRKAIEDFSKAVEFEPNLDNYFQRASTYQRIGDHARAIVDFDKAIEEDPMQPHIYYARAESRAAVGDERAPRRISPEAKRSTILKKDQSEMAPQRKLCTTILVLSALILAGADQAWKNKQYPDWTEDDAKEVMTNSPWAKTVVVTPVKPNGQRDRREAIGTDWFQRFWNRPLGLRRGGTAGR